MNYMISQRKNNNLIRIQKDIVFKYQADEPFSFERFSFTSKLLLDS